MLRCALFARSRTQKIKFNHAYRFWSFRFARNFKHTVIGFTCIITSLELFPKKKKIKYTHERHCVFYKIFTFEIISNNLNVFCFSFWLSFNDPISSLFHFVYTFFITYFQSISFLCRLSFFFRWFTCSSLRDLISHHVSKIEKRKRNKKKRFTH